MSSGQKCLAFKPNVPRYDIIRTLAKFHPQSSLFCLGRLSGHTLKMAADCFQYRSLHSYSKDWEDDIDLEPGDILTVDKASLLSLGIKEGEEEHPECIGWILGFNERTKQRGDFPGTYVQYVGPVKMSVPSCQPRSQRPLPAVPRPEPTASSQGKMLLLLCWPMTNLLNLC